MSDKNDGAAQRGLLWSSWGYAAADQYITLADFQAKYLDRISLSATVDIREVQLMLRALFCPNCVKDETSTYKKNYAALLPSIKDDVMTTFAAMGHLQCMQCGFEEYHPLQHDPRGDRYAQMGQEAWKKKYEQIMADKYRGLQSAQYDSLAAGMAQAQANVNEFTYRQQAAAMQGLAERNLLDTSKLSAGWLSRVLKGGKKGPT